MIKTNSRVHRTYDKFGYEVKIETWKLDADDPGTEMKVAYTLRGHYIGQPIEAYRLCAKKGIAPEPIDEDHNICSIGFCDKEQKWYGWSHRAIFGFGRGSEVKPGDCAFVPSNRKEYIESIMRWYTDEMHKNLLVDVLEDGIRIQYDIIQEGTGRVFHNDHTEPLDIPYGRGAWKAKNLADAKQMAIDFARSVS